MCSVNSSKFTSEKSLAEKKTKVETAGMIEITTPTQIFWNNKVELSVLKFGKEIFFSS